MQRIERRLQQALVDLQVAFNSSLRAQPWTPMIGRDRFVIDRIHRPLEQGLLETP